MADQALDAIIGRIRQVYGAWNRDTTIEEMRRDWEGLLAGVTLPVEVEATSANGVGAAWISAPEANGDRVMLYFHGGGYQLGSIASHRDLTARLSAAGESRVLAVDYRLAPENRFPAPVEDAITVYRWLLDQGYDPAKMSVAGDSAGGGLAIATLLSARSKGLPMPSALAVMSPWTDMSASGASYRTRAGSDPIHQREMILALARTYLGRTGDPADPMASPILADLGGLPPMLVQVGDRETLLDDAVAFAVRARKFGVDAELEVVDGMIHVFQLYADELPEAREAILRIGVFIRRHCNA